MLIFKVFLENDDEDVRQVRVYSNNVKCFWVLSKIESNFDKILTQVFDVIPMFILHSMLILLDSWRNKTRNAGYVGTNQTVGKVTNGVLQIIKYLQAIRKQNARCWYVLNEFLHKVI